VKKPFLFLLITILTLALVGAVSAHDFDGAPRVTTLSGAEVVGGGDADGTGFAALRLNVGQKTICWDVTWSGVEDVFAGHIHQARAGVNGGVVFPLSPLDHGCATADRGLIMAIIASPDQYYVQLHNPEFPGGVIRGQLSNPGQSLQQ
jgi:hypothetical protein